MAKRYIIYCDESDAKGRFYSHFYGGILIEAAKQQAINSELQAVKDELQIFDGEMKWQKITTNYAEKYVSFVNYVFDIIDRGDMKIRIMFTQNRHVPYLQDFQVDKEYFLLYYQFIKHAFGLRYCDGGEGSSAAILLDDVPHNATKLHEFKEYLSSLSAFPIWQRLGFSIAYEDIAEINSKHHNILQALDVVLGGMQSRMNERHTKPVPPAKRRTKRAKAKELVYRSIKDRIFAIYPHFNVGVTTAQRNGPEDRFTMPYRHWLFVPNNVKVDAAKTKKAAGIRK